ncbi:transmembrane protein 272-like [Branchiostoma floridae x Branchiostoma japonicum]
MRQGDSRRNLTSSEVTSPFDDAVSDVSERSSSSSVLTRMRDAYGMSRGPLDYYDKVCEVFVTTALATVLLFVTLALPTAMFLIGIQNLHSCPIEPKIPVYLAVGGAFGMLKTLMMLWQSYEARKNESDDYVGMNDSFATRESNAGVRCFDMFVGLFLFVWFILGNYWVFKVYMPPFERPRLTPSHYCSPTVYLLAFGAICVGYSLMALIGVLLLCIMVLSRGGDDEEEGDPEDSRTLSP